MTKTTAEIAANGLLGRQLKVSQVAVVCNDLQKTMESYTDLLGWGPWSVYRYEPPRLHHTEVAGKPVDYTMLGAETHVGEIDFELLQPLEGPSIYVDWLDSMAKGSIMSP